MRDMSIETFANGLDYKGFRNDDKMPTSKKGSSTLEWKRSR